MRRRSIEPTGGTQAGPRSGLPSFTSPVAGPPASLTVDAQPFEEHRRTQEWGLSGRCRLMTRPAVEPRRIPEAGLGRRLVPLGAGPEIDGLLGAVAIAQQRIAPRPGGPGLKLARDLFGGAFRR